MHQTVRESVAYVNGLAPLASESPAQLFAILPYTSLAVVVEAARRANLWIGAQNMHWASSGEFTGEISAPMLRDLGVDLVLLGHAERRHVFHETDTTIRRKIEAALTHGLRVILCVGETADERRLGAGDVSILRQLQIGLSGIADRSGVIVAYEPVWAIGEHGSAPEAPVVAAAADVIRSVIGTLPLLYGGSVTSESAASYAEISGIDGLFVGRAARTPQGFADVLHAAYPAINYSHERTQETSNVQKERPIIHE